MKLPFGPEWDGDTASPEDLSVIDAAGVDWSRVRHSAYVIHQRITYAYEGPVRRLRQRLVVQPREQHGDQRRVSRHVRVVDATPRRVHSEADDFGNHVVHIDIPYVAEQVSFISWSTVERSPNGPHLLSSSCLTDPRLLGFTPLTTPDEALRQAAADLRRPGVTGEELAFAACRRVFELMRYEHDVSGVRTTAAEAFAQRSGVCQDFAHVLLALTRCLGLPSRYVSGQLIGVGGSHAWVEVMVSNEDGHARVVSLDPTHGRLTGMTYLTIAVGPDYSHVAPVSGTYLARHGGVLTMSKRVAVMRVDPDGLTDVAAPTRLAG